MVFSLILWTTLPGLGQAIYKTLHTFGGQDGAEPRGPLTLASNGCLYGTTGHGGTFDQGALFKINRDGSGYALLHSFMGTNGNPALPDGTSPNGGLVQGSDGSLYGTTAYDYYTEINGYGLLFGDGTAFKIKIDGSGYQVIKRFLGDNNGGVPNSGLIQSTNGLLYGTTSYGGFYGNGVILSSRIFQAPWADAREACCRARMVRFMA
jgi:uncharacterized repeat protein (TIGR03803 family)